MLLFIIGISIFVFQFSAAVKIIYIVSGEPPAAAEKKAAHANAIFFANIKNIAVYLKDFRGKPEFREHRIDRYFFGLNVAPSNSPEGDEHIIKNLLEMGVRSVRVDYGYGSDKVHIERFLNKLINPPTPPLYTSPSPPLEGGDKRGGAKGGNGGFDILLHLVQSKEQAGRMHEKEAQEEWRKFLEEVMSKFSPYIKNYEIGSVPNRKQWSGYTIPDYITALKIASETAKKYDVNIFAPNIQDFEPFYQIAIFEAMKDERIDIQGSTDNLFVDRAGQPEAFDEHVLGKFLRNLTKMDLLNKSRFLNLISEKYGVKTFVCSFTQWNLDVPAHFYRSSEERRANLEEYADYLVRYYVLSAAGGYIDRVYWGHYASYKEGILDDGYNPTQEEEESPEAHHKFIYHGSPETFKIRPAYNGYKTMTAYLRDSSFKKNISDIYHLPLEVFLFEFDRFDRLTGSNQKIYVGWTLNEHSEKVDIFDRNKCQAAKRDGKAINLKEDGIILNK
ncbi:MAG: hypothetical protein HY279_07545, partial [Nitrospinae bacterium]|nr:hypothetical protein [Nitrospinota bacterium]